MAKRDALAKNNEKELETIRKKVRDLEEREMEREEKSDRELSKGEDQDRRNNLVFFGLQQVRPEDVENEVLKFVNCGLRIEMSDLDIVRAHYIGKSNAVLVKFQHYKLREKIYKASYGKPYGIAVKEDYSKRTRRVRAKLGFKYRELREKAKTQNFNPPKFPADHVLYRGEK